MYVVPKLSQCLYLGIDFWKAFGIAPMSIESIGDEVFHETDLVEHKLSFDQHQILSPVKEKFPGFSIEDLGRTSLISYVINTGDSRPIKQRHYSLSPAEIGGC